MNYGSNFMVSLALPTVEEAIGLPPTYFGFAAIGVVALLSIYWTGENEEGEGEGRGEGGAIVEGTIGLTSTILGSAAIGVVVLLTIYWTRDPQPLGRWHCS